MNFETLRHCTESLPYGKRLPGATYVIRPCEGCVPREFLETIRRAEIAAKPDASWNLLKIHTDQFALTFLTYAIALPGAGSPAAHASNHSVTNKSCPIPISLVTARSDPPHCPNAAPEISHSHFQGVGGRCCGALRRPEIAGAISRLFI